MQEEQTAEEFKDRKNSLLVLDSLADTHLEVVRVLESRWGYEIIERQSTPFKDPHIILSAEECVYIYEFDNTHEELIERLIYLSCGFDQCLLIIEVEDVKYIPIVSIWMSRLISCVHFLKIKCMVSTCPQVTAEYIHCSYIGRIKEVAIQSKVNLFLSTFPWLNWGRLKNITWEIIWSMNTGNQSGHPNGNDWNILHIFHLDNEKTLIKST